jgi:hypothetical protein
LKYAEPPTGIGHLERLLYAAARSERIDRAIVRMSMGKNPVLTI